MRAIALSWALASALAVPAPARAYHVLSTVTEGCHEELSTTALAKVRADLGLGSPEPDAADAALVRDVPFALAEGLRDVEAASLVIGARYADVMGKNPMDTVALSPAHNAYDTQRDHCLRRPEHDEPNGSEEALAACRDLAEQKALHAITAGVGEDGRPDLSRRTHYDVFLTWSGARRPRLPIFYVYLGEALHILHDSYSHAFRTPDHARVTATMNWLDMASDDYSVFRDGPEHLGLLDDCVNIDDFRKARFEVAREASVELLTAALDPKLDPAQREAAVRGVFERRMAFQPGCTAENHWCDAPETEYLPIGCQQAGAARLAGWWWGLPLVAVALLRRSGRRAASVAAALALALAPSTSRAQAPADGTPRCIPGQMSVVGCPAGAAQRCRDDGSGFDACAAMPDPARPPAPQLQAQPVVEPPLPLGTKPAPSDPTWNPKGFGVALSLSVAIDKPAAAVALGGRYSFDEFWRLGLNVEWNPWMSFGALRFHQGVLNYFLTATRRFPVNEAVAVRMSAHLGLSTLLVDLVGARGGTTGMVVGVSLLGVDTLVGKNWRVIVDPCNIMVPVPQFNGLPLVYQQYRFTVGIEYGRQ